MAIQQHETFELGTNGNNLTTATLEGGTVPLPAATLVFSNAQAKLGGLSAKINTSSNFIQVRESLPALGSILYARIYGYLTAIPAANAYILVGRNGSTQVGDVRINPTGTLTVRDNTSGASTCLTTLTTNQWFRVEYKAAPGVEQRVRLYVGANVDGITPDEEWSTTATNSGLTQVDSFLWGNTAAGTLSMYVDEVILEDANWPGPASFPGFQSGYRVTIG